MAAKDQYIPGVCNIGPAEIAKRRQTGWGGLIATVVLWGIFIGFDTPHVWRLSLFIPTLMSSTGFLQARMHFCAYFGFASFFNFESKVGDTNDVLEAEFRAKDKEKAWQILIYSSLIALAVALIAFAL
jgi:hypothetical protein